MKALGLFFVLAGAAFSAQDNSTVEWLGSYREALRQAKETHKPIFVEFRCEA